ncbi:hypothetical protein CRG98_017747 [Punica granatum]|uniref:Uncharacterized protein n=1 Tax=Punica granatum TaxID=22663 RepID=A0A2I0JZV6_PUNGR|nr:hypothetical protein CRG98_017747 [Punica granatum]
MTPRLGSRAWCEITCGSLEPSARPPVGLASLKWLRVQVSRSGAHEPWVHELWVRRRTNFSPILVSEVESGFVALRSARNGEGPHPSFLSFPETYSAGACQRGRSLTELGMGSSPWGSLPMESPTETPQLFFCFGVGVE